jgi:hypothetical protein
MEEGHKPSFRQMNSNPSSMGQEVIRFVKDIFNYVYTRIRQVVVGVWIFVTVVLGNADNIKKGMM